MNNADSQALVQVEAARVYEQNLTFYSLTIDGAQAYYVVAGDTPVLVHNTSCGIPGAAQVADIANQLGFDTLPNFSDVAWGGIARKGRWIYGRQNILKP